MSINGLAVGSDGGGGESELALNINLTWFLCISGCHSVA